MSRPKRDIFYFNGNGPRAVNMEHVTHMSVEENRITFHFYANSLSVDMKNEQEAVSCFEKLLNVWVSDVDNNGQTT